MTSCVLLLLCALAITLQVHDVTSLSFSPSSLPLIPTMQGDLGVLVTLMCQADTPLKKCQVNMYNKFYSFDFVDLSRGANSSVISGYHESYGNVPIYNVSYFGTGLENGQCGAVYSLSAPMSFHFGCRGADEDGQWQDMVQVLAISLEAFPASITPLKTIAKPGSNVSILLHSSESMLYCMMGPTVYSNEAIVFMEGATSVATESYRYFGSSPSLGDCGITLLNVTEENNGLMTIMGVPNEQKVAILVSTVIIATPPAEVYLTVDAPFHTIGNMLTAKCSSLLSRPVANLTWILDDEIIRQNNYRDVGGDVWTWSWEKQNITQNMKFSVQPEHIGKKLECRVQHFDTVISKSFLINEW